MSDNVVSELQKKQKKLTKQYVRQSKLMNLNIYLAMLSSPLAIATFIAGFFAWPCFIVSGITIAMIGPCLCLASNHSDKADITKLRIDNNDILLDKLLDPFLEEDNAKLIADAKEALSEQKGKTQKIYIQQKPEEISKETLSSDEDSQQTFGL